MAFTKTRKEATGEHGERRAHARDFTSLVAQLEDPNPTARRWAARDLTDFPASSAALLDRLQREEELSVREVILTTLTSIGDSVAMLGLIACLRSEDVGLRNQAIQAMQQLPEAVELIIDGLLADADPDVRIFAVNILESLRHPRVESWLIRVIEQDSHLNVCAAAVDLLGEVGTPAAREPLLRPKARYGAEPYIEFAADLALKRINEG